MFTPELNEYDVIIMIMSLFFSLLRVLLRHCSALSFSWWTLMSYTAGNAPGLFFFNINLKSENKQGFEEADCQTYTHVPPSAAPSPYNSPRPRWLHHFIPCDPAGARSAPQWQAKRGVVKIEEPKWHVAFSLTDTSETPEGGPAGFAL